MTHFIHSAPACHQRIDATIPSPPCRHNDGDAVPLQNDATHSPHKQSNAVVGESGAPISEMTPAQVVVRHHQKIRQAIDLLEHASRDIVDGIDSDDSTWPDVWKFSAYAEAAADLIERLER